MRLLLHSLGLDSTELSDKGLAKACATYIDTALDSLRLQDLCSVRTNKRNYVSGPRHFIKQNSPNFKRYFRSILNKFRTYTQTQLILITSDTGTNCSDYDSRPGLTALKFLFCQLGQIKISDVSFL